MAKMGILKFVMHMRPHFGQNFLPKFLDSRDFVKCPRAAPEEYAVEGSSDAAVTYSGNNF